MTLPDTGVMTTAAQCWCVNRNFGTDCESETLCGKPSVRQQPAGRSARLRPAAVDKVTVCGKLRRQGEMLHSAATIRLALFH